MLKLDYLLICEDVIIDDKARISAIKIFDSINVRSLPTRHSSFNIIFRLTAEPKAITKDQTIKLGFRVVDPNMKVLASAVTSLKDLSIKKGAGLSSSANLSQTVFELEGTHRVDLLVGNEVVGGRNFGVVKYAK